MIQNNVERMSALISDLANINRLESGRLVLELDPLTLADPVSGATIKIGPTLDAKNQTLEINFPLLDNANKYSVTGVSIQLRILKIHDRIRIEVIDSGIGSEGQKNIFT
jgi:signal transduction histidine kinase